MRVHRPTTLDAALDVLGGQPDLVPVAGGTDVMVAVNFGRLRPRGFVDLHRLGELKAVECGPTVWCGAGASYSAVLDRLAGSVPVVDEAVRTIGSPQIRNAGTIGGNLGTCSPAGDVLPVLGVLDATIVTRSCRGERRLSLDDWMVGPKRSACLPGELVVGVEWRRAPSAQVFMKVGTRNAMVIAVASLAMLVDRAARTVRVALGSVGPRIVRPAEAEAFACQLYDEAGWDRPLPAGALAARRFADLVASAVSPIDDVRATARYRRHVVAVMAERALSRTAEPR